MTVVLIKNGFITGGNVFERGEFYCFSPDDNRNRAGWVVITNRNYEYAALVPESEVIRADFTTLSRLKDGGFLLYGLCDRTSGSLSRAGGAE